MLRWHYSDGFCLYFVNILTMMSLHNQDKYLIAESLPFFEFHDTRYLLELIIRERIMATNYVGSRPLHWYVEVSVLNCTSIAILLHIDIKTSGPDPTYLCLHAMLRWPAHFMDNQILNTVFNYRKACCLTSKGLCTKRAEAWYVQWNLRSSVIQK